MYKTKPIDYTGCNEIIADHLRRGLAIECYVWDDIDGDNRKTRTVNRFNAGKPYTYETGKSVYKHAEPIKYAETKTLKQPVELMQVLVDGGWKVGINGTWHHDTKMPFYPSFWHYCGKEAFDILDESWFDTTLKPLA